MATSSSLRGLGSKCRALMAASAKSTSASAATPASSAASKPKPSTKKSSQAPAPSSSSSTRGQPLLKPVKVSHQLGQFIGAPEASRPFVLKKVWEYIKSRELQDPANKRMIRTDEKLKTIFAGKDEVNFLEIGKLLSPHFIKA